MESLLRNRQLHLWEVICAAYSIPAARRHRVTHHIREGTLAEYLENRGSSKGKKPTR